MVFAFLVNYDFIARRKCFYPFNNRLFVNKTFFTGYNQSGCPASVKIIRQFGISDNRTIVRENRFESFNKSAFSGIVLC